MIAITVARIAYVTRPVMLSPVCNTSLMIAFIASFQASAATRPSDAEASVIIVCKNILWLIVLSLSRSFAVGKAWRFYVIIK